MIKYIIEANSLINKKNYFISQVKHNKIDFGFTVQQEFPNK